LHALTKKHSSEKNRLPSNRKHSEKRKKVLLEKEGKEAVKRFSQKNRLTKTASTGPVAEHENVAKKLEKKGEKEVS